ncbi:MAG: response regulator, partial [Flammeovirgaceae bacterium]|nr:response regulator [Flammeovirgaceae bacterium]MDW8287886.1 response regulator [Flammeovirgaceae bacterium]
MNPVIVCIDDEDIILSSLRKDISEFLGGQYMIEVATSGEEALELIKELIQEKKEIPLIISDYIMPGMKGDELLAKVHQLLPKTLKIMLTGQANMQGIVNAINYAQLYRYIPKPWEKEDLKLAVKEACDKYFKEKLLEKQNQELKELTQSLERKVIERTFELQKKAEELAEKNRQLSEANELKIRIFSVISHDIREPISALEGVLDILSDKAYLLSPEEIKEAAQELSISVR